MAFSADPEALAGAGTTLSLWPLSLAVSTTDQLRATDAEASALAIIMEKLAAKMDLGNLCVLHKKCMIGFE
jgi:hypothetical protein